MALIRKLIPAEYYPTVVINGFAPLIRTYVHLSFVSEDTQAYTYVSLPRYQGN